MKEELFLRAMNEGSLAEKTVSMRLNALKRVERNESIDLDEEFDRDEMASLLARFTYSPGDETAHRPNPTKMNVGKRSLLSVLRWYKSHLNQYRKFRLNGAAGIDPDDLEGDGSDAGADDVDPNSPSRFGLEADLQAALRDEIAQLEAGLEVVDGGAERKVASGFIDILAKDAAGHFVVIELKAGTARDAVIAQVLGYMGDIAEETGAPVRGIVVAADFRPRVESAARAIPNLVLRSYRYRFEFR